MNYWIKILPNLILVLIIIFFENFGNTNAIDFNKENLNLENNNEKNILRNKDVKRNYDEYPLVVPKRAALLLDRLMVALQHVLDDDNNDDKNQVRTLNGYYGNGNNLYGPRPPHRQKTFHIRPRLFFKDLPINIGIENGQYDYAPANQNYKNLQNIKPDNFDIDLIEKNFQRRAHEEESFGSQIGRIYWRCYFNAVTCF